jgi:5-methylthioadenosine/S-adenosylhomocysteine deaminase
MGKKAIVNTRIYTSDALDHFYKNGVIVWEKDRILAVGRKDEIQLNENIEVLDGKDRLAVLPGFIDVHSHSSLLKGYSEDLDFLDWLPEYQREHKVLNEEDAYFASMINYLEALKGGTTCVLDMYRYMHKSAEAASQLGMRVHLAPYVSDLAGGFFETIDNNEKLIQSHHQSSNGKVQIMAGLEHLFYCSPEAYKKARFLSDEYGVYIHTHTSEFENEVKAVKNHFGKLPVYLLKERDILTPKTIVAHCVHLKDEELKIFADHDVRIAHCPTSNVKLGGGSVNLDRFKQYNIKFGLGSDGVISNNGLSMWELMKFGSLLQKNLSMSAKAYNANEVLRLATIEGAKVLGQEGEIGSLEPGKKADFITVDLWQPHLMPIASTPDYDPVLWNLVYAGRASDVRDVWIDGVKVVSNGMATGVNETELMDATHRQSIDLLKRRAGTVASDFIQ